MTVDAPAETRTPMSWEEYEALGEMRGEYFGGQLVVPSAPSHQHQDIVFALAVALQATLRPGTVMVPGWGWSPAGTREELVPDVMVHRATDEDTRLTREPPLLVVEVLSFNRRTDLVEKMQRYARWGAPTYWTLDPRERELVVHDLRDGMFGVTAVHSDGTVTVGYAGHEIELDLDAVLT